MFLHYYYYFILSPFMFISMMIFCLTFFSQFDISNFFNLRNELYYHAASRLHNYAYYLNLKFHPLISRNNIITSRCNNNNNNNNPLYKFRHPSQRSESCSSHGLLRNWQNRFWPIFNQDCDEKEETCPRLLSQQAGNDRVVSSGEDFRHFRV